MSDRPPASIALNNSGAHLRVKTARREYHNPTRARRLRLWRIIGDRAPQQTGNWRVYAVARRPDQTALAQAAAAPVIRRRPKRAPSGVYPAEIGAAP